MANDPWTSARLGSNNDAPAGGQFLAELVNELGKWTEPTFPTVAARDTALQNWVANGNVAVDGMRCRTANDKQTWVLIGGVWTWPKAAQGQLAIAKFSDSGNSASNGMTPLAAAPTGLPAFNVSVPSVPAGRNLEVTFAGEIMTTVDKTAFAFVLNFMGFQGRGVIQIPMGSPTSNPIPQKFNITYPITTTAQAAPAIGGVQSASLWAGTGACYLVSRAGDLDQPTYLSVKDVGAV